jgi:hypothetical protein
MKRSFRLPAARRPAQPSPMPLPPDDAFQNPHIARLSWVGAAVIVVMALVLAASYLMPVGLTPSERAMTDRADWEMRQLGRAIEAYLADHGATPAPRLLREMAGPAADLERLRDAGGWDVAGVEPGGLGPAGVLRPKPYLERLHADVFAPLPGLPPGYITDGRAWLLFSPGPDGVYDVPSGTPADAPLELLAPMRHDAANGVGSSGDLILSSRDLVEEEPAP